MRKKEGPCSQLSTRLLVSSDDPSSTRTHSKILQRLFFQSVGTLFPECVRDLYVGVNTVKRGDVFFALSNETFVIPYPGLRF